MAKSSGTKQDADVTADTGPKRTRQRTRKTKTADGQSTNRARDDAGKRTEGLVTEATRIVEQAASILEDEIAAGIVAAKRVEKSYLNVDALRSNDTEQVLHRFRTDAHEVLDILLDLVNLSVNAVSGLAKRAVTIRGATGTNSGREESRTAVGEIPELIVPTTVRPGESGKISMMVENEGDSPTGDATFVTGGLLSPGGDRLDSDRVEFDPPSLVISPHDLEKVVITLNVPECTPAGRYTGLVESAELQVKAIVTVQIEENP